MRELTKSMFSYTWAMSLFGVQQMVNMLTFEQSNGGSKTTKAFEDVTDATAETFDGSLKSAFRAGDQLQRGVIDLIFGGLMGCGCNASGWTAQAADSKPDMGDSGMRTTGGGATRDMAAAGMRSARDMADAGRRTAQRTADMVRDMTDVGMRVAQSAASYTGGAAAGPGPSRAGAQGQPGGMGWGPMPKPR